MPSLIEENILKYLLIALLFKFPIKTHKAGHLKNIDILSALYIDRYGINPESSIKPVKTKIDADSLQCVQQGRLLRHPSFQKLRQDSHHPSRTSTRRDRPAFPSQATEEHLLSHNRFL